MCYFYSQKSNIAFKEALWEKEYFMYWWKENSGDQVLTIAISRFSLRGPGEGEVQGVSPPAQLGHLATVGVLGREGAVEGCRFSGEERTYSELLSLQPEDHRDGTLAPRPWVGGTSPLQCLGAIFTLPGAAARWVRIWNHKGLTKAQLLAHVVRKEVSLFSPQKLGGSCWGHPSFYRERNWEAEWWSDFWNITQAIWTLASSSIQNPKKTSICVPIFSLHHLSTLKQHKSNGLEEKRGAWDTEQRGKIFHWQSMQTGFLKNLFCVSPSRPVPHCVRCNSSLAHIKSPMLPSFPPAWPAFPPYSEILFPKTHLLYHAKQCGLIWFSSYLLW